MTDGRSLVVIIHLTTADLAWLVLAIACWVAAGIAAWLGGRR